MQLNDFPKPDTLGCKKKIIGKEKKTMSVL